jgi:tRNA nucleotidyltransferase (CCA-adding enzyme)
MTVSDNHQRLAALAIDLPEQFDGLDVYAVGGVVRALFTGNDSSDVDLAVGGVTPDELLHRGFTLVVGGNTPNTMTNRAFTHRAEQAAHDGRLMAFLDEFDGTGFPVFIDERGREVALLRTERSTGAGHRAFEPVIGPEVSIEDDLSRRDFTVNALAVALTDAGDHGAGALIDPFGGQSDLDDAVLRMVSERTFAEDPLRILRLARFAARLDFEIGPDTFDAARQEVQGLHALPNERWGMELVKALKQAPAPSRFFRVLDGLGALSVVLPELAVLTNVPAGPPHAHEEGTAFDHTMLVIDEMAQLRPGEPRALLAAMAHDLGKGLTPVETLPSHPKHHLLGARLVEPLVERLCLSNELEGVMRSAARQHMKCHDLTDLRAKTMLELAEALRADYSVDNPGDEPTVAHLTVEEFIDLGVADSRGRRPQGKFDAEAARERFNRALAVLDSVGGEHVIDRFDPDPDDGEQFARLLEQERIRAFQNPSAFGLEAC